MQSRSKSARALEPVAVGDVIAGKYRVERVLGKGGMGMVVAATHLDLHKLRAIKLMLPEASRVSLAAERFLREARAASALTSEHVAHVFDIGRLDDGTPFMVMEHLSGRDLRDELSQRGALLVEETALYALQICDALAEAHALGIVHRDLKPSNLFLTTGRDGSPHIKLLDFGISKMLDTSVADPTRIRTTNGALLGSPRYMSPEQIRADRDLDARSDIWSMGVILYELVTGRPPFHSDDALLVFAMIFETEPVPPSRRAPRLPSGLDAVILRCLEKPPARRYPDVAALARDLLPFAGPDATRLVERIERVISPSCARSQSAPPPTAQDTDPLGHTATVSTTRDRVIALDIQDDDAQGSARSALVRRRSEAHLTSTATLTVDSATGLDAAEEADDEAPDQKA